MCSKGLIEAASGKLINFMLFIFLLLFPPHPTPSHSHAFVAMQFIMLVMGSVCLGVLACAIKV